MYRFKTDRVISFFSCQLNFFGFDRSYLLSSPTKWRSDRTTEFEMRLNRIGAVAALLLSCLWVNAQVTVTGIVKDKTDNQPLPMVSVRMLAAKDSSYVAGVSSNMNGAFTLNASKPGNYLLAFSFLGITPNMCRCVLRWRRPSAMSVSFSWSRVLSFWKKRS